MLAGIRESGISRINRVRSETNQQLVHKPKKASLETFWRHAVHGDGWSSASAPRSSVHGWSLHGRWTLSSWPIKDPKVLAIYHNNLLLLSCYNSWFETPYITLLLIALFVLQYVIYRPRGLWDFLVREICSIFFFAFFFVCFVFAYVLFIIY